GENKKGKIVTKISGLGYAIGKRLGFKKSTDHVHGIKGVKEVRKQVKDLHEKVREFQARSGCYEIIENNYRTNYIQIKNQIDRKEKSTRSDNHIEHASIRHKACAVGRPEPEG
ncbi:hypothetical protein, partial [Mycolicibacterium hippocampi]|uniref:hypothetical protein n=1 Tax=Mycolicibacterium hippocampi TaxID=659824 RepID=UPI0035171201